MYLRIAIFLWLLTAISAPAFAGESFNLDFGPSITGLPGTYGAASGQTGTWVPVDSNTPISALVNISGQATSVGITVAGVGFSGGSSATYDAILLGHGIGSPYEEGVPLSVSVTDLPFGTYDIYYYSLADFNLRGLTLNGVPMPDLAGGSREELGLRGTNWSVVRTTVTDGTLTILDTTPVFFDALSGIQIKFIFKPDLIFSSSFESAGSRL